MDLAARGLIEIEDRGIGRYWCRLTGRTENVTPYERMLLEHLRSVAAGGVVPAEALTTGPQDRSKAWWNDFRKKVVAHAQADDLSADLWDLRSQGILLGAGLVLAVLYAVATGFRDPGDIARSGLFDGVVFGGLMVVLAFGAVVGSKRQTSTDRGVEAASRWSGVRKALEESPSFEVLPPSGVVVWERHLAYGAALGVAPRSIRALPMGAESDDEVWTASSGEWRKVTVRYPRFRPGWGRAPLPAVGMGALGVLFAWWLLRLVTGDLGGDDVWLKATAGVLGVLAIVVLARSIAQLLLAFPDLFGARTVEATVLRARTRRGALPYFTQMGGNHYVRYFVALDDPGATKLTAYRVSPALYERLPQGSRAKLKVTRNLGYVRRPSG